MTSPLPLSNTRTAGFSSLLRNELRYQVWSRHLLGAAAIYLATAVVAVVGLVSRAGSKIALFQTTLTESKRNGITLADALTQPVVVTQGADGTTINNILRYDYDTARTAIGSLTPLGFAVNTLQMLCFLVIPAVCVVMGVVLTTRDYRYGTIKVQAVRWPLSTAHAAQLVSCMCVGFVALLSSVVLSLIMSPIARSVFLRQHAVSIQGMPAGPGVAELLTTLGLTLAITVFFSCVGIGMGLLFRKALAPALIFILWNTMCPMLGRWDPRSIWSGLGNRVFRFDGVFTLTPAAGTSLAVALPLLAGIALALVLAGHVVSRRGSRFGV